MKTSKLTGLAEDFGRSDFVKKVPRASRSQKKLIAAFICFFVLTAFIADLWPCKKTYFFFAYQGGLKPFTVLDQITPALRYSEGQAWAEFQSLSYLVMLKLFSPIIPCRLLNLRVLNIIISCASLFFLYRLAAILFSRAVGLVFLFLLVTSPVYVESSRAFGYEALTHLAVAVACYLLASSLNNEKVVAKIVLLSFFCLLTMSLYVIGRLVILFPVIFFGFYLKKYWSKLLIYLLLFGGIILILDNSLGDVRFTLRDFFLLPALTDEWLDTETEGGSPQKTLSRNIPTNARVAWGYLTGRERRAFADEDDRSRLFNPVYTPSLFLGLLVCLWMRKRSNIFLLIWFALFFMVPMISSRIDPRRILLALEPIYLIVALGLWFLFQLLSRIIPHHKYRFALTCAALILLGLIGSFDVREFFFKVSKPYYNYSREQLKQVADFIMEEGRGITSIIYNIPTRDLIWGNPYFIDHPESLGLANKIVRDQAGYKGLRNNLEHALREGKSLLYLYTFPCTTPYYTDKDYDTLFSDIEWAERNLSDRIQHSSIPGTKLHYVMLEQ